MPPIKIIRQSLQTELSPSGAVNRLIRIDFMVGEDGPFNLTFPQSEYNADVAFQKIQDFALQTHTVRQKFSGG